MKELKIKQQSREEKFLKRLIIVNDITYENIRDKQNGNKNKNRNR